MHATMPPPKKTKTMLLRMDPATASALAAYIAAQDVPPKRNPVVIAALRRFLAERGHWPLPRPKS